MEQLSKLIRQRLRATAKNGGSHPDPNLLAAFADKALAKTERVQVLEHLARCVDCREIVSLATPEFETAGAVPAAPSSGWLRGPILRWGTLAASVAVVTVAVTLPKLSRHLSSVAPTQSAQTDVRETAPEARRDEPADKLAASASASYRAPEADSVAKQPKRGEFSNRMNVERVPKPSRSSQAAEGYSARPMPQATVPAAPALLAKSADEDQAELKKEQGSNMQVATSNEVVSLAKAAPAAAEITPGKAKDAPLQAQAGLVRNGAQALAGRSMADASSAKNDELRSRSKAVPRWTLSSDGTLQRSFDAGKTWATIPVAGNSVFRALAAVGANIWVGGSGGSLYRSADAGEHWLKVSPASSGKVLTADIIGVEFTDANHGKLTTADEQIWTTADAGQTWQTN
ncbi:MAG TPA: YCF48-related protein [Terriglobales bacterium]|nr:YCF48-related protein [Terriglobales bacterium]